MSKPLKWTPPTPPSAPPGATLPRAPFINGDGRYDSAAYTNVSAAFARERKRIGALTGAQVRAQRAARIKSDREAASGKTQQTLELVTSSVYSIDPRDPSLQLSPTTRKAAR